MKGRKKQATRTSGSQDRREKQPRSGPTSATEDSRDQEIARLRAELQASTTALSAAHAQIKEALDHQTATAEILRVISRSPGDLRPVAQTIAETAARLVQAYDGSIFRLEGDVARLIAHHGPMPALPDLTIPVVRGTVTGRCIVDRRAVHVYDLQAEQAEFPEGSELARRLGHRTIIAIPLLGEGKVLGTMQVRRFEARPFTEQQIALLQTFANQAVIAIENARLFTDLAEKNRALTSALDQHTATGEILRIIASSPADVQPVFEAIVRSAGALCHASDVVMLIAENDALHVGASVGPVAAAVRQSEGLRGGLLLSRGSVSGRAFIDRRTIHIHDVSAMPDDEFREGKLLQRSYGGRGTTLSVPLLRDGVSLGVITLVRGEVKPFTERQLTLLEMFADQAVIAIENVRLFTELRANNEALTRAHAQVTEALEQQTATSEILRVISGSPTDVEPVFKTILTNANRLCDASFAMLWIWDGETVRAVAHENVSPALAERMATAQPRPHRGTPLGLSLLERTVVHVADVVTDHRFTPEEVPTYRLEGARSILAVPMLREGNLLGVINIWRREPRAFTDGQIALLRTFADQAVIAIENVRLFKELEARTAALTRSVDQLTALGEVGRAVSSTLDLETVLTTIVSRAAELTGTEGGAIYEYDEAAERFWLRADHGLATGLLTGPRQVGIPKGEGALGRLAITRQPIQILDLADEAAYQSHLREALLAAGIRSLLAVPLLSEDRLIGGLVVNRTQPGEFGSEVVDLLRTFATQSALAIQNARLFREIEVKSRELAAASQHKSEFLANMSHELRTPLNGIIGFSEVMLERMFGEINEKQEEYLGDILSSGRHLLSLINDILDLSKIEAGKMDLELTEFDAPAAIDNAMMLIRERATRRGQVLERAVDPALGQIRADERKFKQVLLNLLSNAVKFTPEGGQITVSAGAANGEGVVSVTEIGIGIAPEHQDLVFEEFRQVGHADKKAEGTGLGLALCRKLIELHGGRIWLASEVGKGSTFTFALPVSGPPAAPPQRP